jgi:hypothetical protein
LKVGAELAGRGHEVIARPASGVGQTADFLVDGKPTELKTIIDARNQHGLTEANARAAMQNAVRGLPKSRINEVRLLGRDGNQSFEIVVKK